MSLSDRLSSASSTNKADKADDASEPSDGGATSEATDKQFDAFDLYHEGEVDDASVVGKVKKLFGRSAKDSAAVETEPQEEAAVPQPVFDAAMAFKPLDEVIDAPGIDSAATRDAAEFADMTAAEAPDDAADISATTSDEASTTTETTPVQDLEDASAPADFSDILDAPAPTEPIKIEPVVTQPKPEVREPKLDIATTAPAEAVSVARQSGASAAAAAAVSATSLRSEQAKADQFWSPYADTFRELAVAVLQTTESTPSKPLIVPQPAAEPASFGVSAPALPTSTAVAFDDLPYADDTPDDAADDAAADESLLDSTGILEAAEITEAESAPEIPDIPDIPEVAEAELAPEIPEVAEAVEIAERAESVEVAAIAQLAETLPSETLPLVATPTRIAPVLPAAPMLDVLPTDGVVPPAQQTGRPDDNKNDVFEPAGEHQPSVPCPSCGTPTNSDLVDEANGLSHFSCDQCYKIWQTPLP